MVSSNLLSLSYGAIVRKDISSSDGLLPESFETYNVIERNDIVLRLTDLQNDKRSLRSGLATEDGIITSAYTTVRPVAVEPRFMAHQLRAIDLAKTLYSLGGGLRQSLGFDDIKTLPIALPPTPEQRQIADYLDHETAEIDAFIADLEAARATTLERFVAMRAEAIRGQYGAARELRRFVDYVTSGSRGWSELLGDEGDPFIRITNIARNSLALQMTDLRRVQGVDRAEGARARVEIGDVLMSITADLGSVGIAEAEVAGGYTSQHVALIRPNRLLCDPRYLGHALLTPSTKAQIAEKSYGGTKIQLSLSDVREIVVPLPSLHDQKQLALTLDSAEQSRDEQVADIDAAITLAAERRAALITAAVTGQINTTTRRRPVVDSIRTVIEEAP